MLAAMMKTLIPRIIVSANFCFEGNSNLLTHGTIMRTSHTSVIECRLALAMSKVVNSKHFMGAPKNSPGAGWH